MKRFSVFGIVAALVSVLNAAPVAGLPRWSEADQVKLKAGEIVVGQALLTEAGLDSQEDVPKAAEVLIEAVEEKPSLFEDQKLARDSAVSGVHLQRYFGTRPEESLIDPQELLSMQERADLQHALDLHSQESEVALFVYIFDADQNLPSQYDVRSVYEDLFADNAEPIVVVYYFLEAPLRSRLLLAGGAGDSIPEWQVRELLWNTASKAQQKSAAFDQLEDFVGQLSMRMFWIEETLRELAEQEIYVVEVDAVKGKVADARSEKMKEIWEGAAQGYVFQAVWCVAGGLVACFLCVVFVCRRRYVFPDAASPARLGGAVGGSFGGVLSYRDPHLPPSDQKHQVDVEFF